MKDKEYIDPREVLREMEEYYDSGAAERDAQRAMAYVTMIQTNFFERCRFFIEKVQVHDAMGDEEQEYLLRMLEAYINPQQEEKFHDSKSAYDRTIDLSSSKGRGGKE